MIIRTKLFARLIVPLATLLFFTGCEDFLEEEVFTQYDPNAFLQDRSGVDALLVGAYAEMDIASGRNYNLILSEWTTDIALQSGGGLERLVVPFIQFNWDPTLGFFNDQWNQFYGAIARANNVLDVVRSTPELDEDIKTQLTGEARFIRGFSYYILHNLFGPTPIIEIPPGASLEEIQELGNTPRPTEEEYREYVEADLRFASENLPDTELSSKGDKGSALAMLTKFHLHNKEWQKAADAANQILGLNYSLYDDYEILFSVDGEDNNEYLLRWVCQVGSTQNNRYMALAFPPNFPIQDNWTNFGAQARTYTQFYETFEEQDIRRKLFLENYIPVGETELVQLNRDADGNPLDNVRSFKYTPDPNANGVLHGNDIPFVRLADIILVRAEALNEISGPNEESIALINQVRQRANASLISLSEFSSKEALRDFILAERARELYTEGVRREDLIRHGKFIERAIERGFAAQDFQVLYPIPQAQMDNNPNLVQNDGYN